MSNIKKEENMLQVIAALEYLKKTSERDGLDDVAELIDSTFKICINTYLILNRTGFTDYNIKIKS